MSTGRHEWPPALSEKALRQLIAVAIEKGYYRESFHASSEHPERGISLEDIVHGLEQPWKLAKPPDYDEKHRTWEYLICTTGIEGDALHIKLAAFPNEKRIEVITRW